MSRRTEELLTRLEEYFGLGALEPVQCSWGDQPVWLTPMEIAAVLREVDGMTRGISSARRTSDA